MSDNIDYRLWINQFMLSLRSGYIEQCKEDGIVNSTNHDLDLQRNSSAAALAKAAGPSLQKECSTLSPLNAGEVKVSKAHNLPCKIVLHSWISTEKDLKNAIMKSLHVADKLHNCKSVAFPALGTGVLKISAEVVARCFIQCLIDYTSGNPKHLQEVCIVILPRDTHIYEKFLAVFKEHQSSTTSLHFMELSVGSISGEPMVPVDENSTEFKNVMANFKSSFGSSSVSVLQILRIVNHSQWVKYYEHRRHVSNQLNMAPHNVERTLWHGTSQETAIEIARFGFNRSYAGKNGTLYGKGCYFAANSSYFTRYSTPSAAGEKYMLQSKVVVGKFTKGDSTLIDAPKISSSQKFDSVVDDVQNPSIFVVFSDTAAYPEYIIRYKPGGGECILL